MSIGNVLSELLKKFNLNALELERLTGVPASTIYRLLKNNGGNPTIEVLRKLSFFFQITVSQLIGEDPLGSKQIHLINPENIANYISAPNEKFYEGKMISSDFPLNPNCFATIAQDNMMEPFILENSIIIVDPERDITNKDFILLIKNKNEKPFVRQFIDNGEEQFLKVLHSDFRELKKSNLRDFYFVAVIIHYRTNLFKYETNTKNDQKSKMPGVVINGGK